MLSNSTSSWLTRRDRHSRIKDVIADESKTLLLDLVVVGSKSSLCSNRALSNWLHHSRIGVVVLAESKTSPQRIEYSPAWPRHGRVEEIVTAKSKNFCLGFIMAELERYGQMEYSFTWPRYSQIWYVATAKSMTSPWSDQRISDLASSWLNQGDYHSQIEASLTRRHHNQIGEVITAESKTVWLGLVIAKSKRSLWPSRRISDSTSSWPNRRNVMAKSERSS